MIFSTFMTLLIMFKPWRRPISFLRPWWFELLMALIVFFGLALSQFGIEALLDPEVSEKLKERLKEREAQLKERSKRRDEEYRKRVKEAWEAWWKAWKEFKEEWTRKT
jgi:uncharacterized membrane protein (DUF106 family)